MDKFKDEMDLLLAGLSDDERALFNEKMNDMLGGFDAESLWGGHSSITTLMHHYKVKEIKDLCKQYGIKGYSSLNKDEMLYHFITNLVTQEYFNQTVDRFNEDEKLALIMTNQYNAWGDSFETRLKIQDNFILFGVDEGDGYVYPWIPDEILDKVEQYIKQNESLRKIQLAYDLLEAATNLYGLYTFTQLQEVYREYLGESYSLLDIQKWINRVERVNPEMINFREENGVIVSKGLELEVIDYPHFMKDANYYMPETIEEMLRYKEWVMGIDEETQIDFLTWLDKNVIKNNPLNAIPDELAVELLTMMRHAVSYDMIDNVLNAMVEDGILKKRVASTGKNVVKPIFMKIRSWLYHGYTFKEYMKIMDQEEQQQRGKVIDFKQHRKK
ncbi:Rho termination factor N-terminal domain-containing protein [Staphylococcus canis]|uniref:Rho termination factor N-terminal domain-containing protein n=1 Tax=Staphylococcus canis TaxID=2724942 RepID=A0ABS0T6I4_9STAP|nr:Rho termination factor N-terminal domain-containing protein [Staphylococcus canis]MBI5974354.1 hypothetical protein [Staphylococcus canis]